MLKKAGLGCYIYGALFIAHYLVTFGGRPATSHNIQGSRHLSYTIASPGAFAGYHVLFSTPTVKNDHVKVRYMGGDCGYDPSPLLVAMRMPKYNLSASPTDRTTFIFTPFQLLFKLRGPPAENKLT